MTSSVEDRAVVRIAPNNPVFDLPVIVAIEEGLFAKAGLDVSFSATYADREKDQAERPIMSRLKEQLFDDGSADSYNVCEWASIDRLERGRRGGNIAALRAAVAAQAILTFDEALQVPRDLADVPVVVQELTGSHYTTVQMLESAIGNEHIKLVHGGLPQMRWEGLKNRTYRAITVMEPFISLGLKQGAHIIASSFYRGGEVISPDLTPEQSDNATTRLRTRQSISSMPISTNTPITWLHLPRARWSRMNCSGPLSVTNTWTITTRRCSAVPMTG